MSSSKPASASTRKPVRIWSPLTAAGAAIAVNSVFFFTSTTPLYAADDATTTTSDTIINSDSASGGRPQKRVLQGGINHADQLPSLQDNLKPGSVYSDDLLTQAGAETNDLWYYIPDWYAGKRHVDENFIFYRYDYRTKEETQPMLRQLNRQDSTSGCLQDRKGGIWDYKHTPIIQHVESDLVNAVLFVRKFTPLAGNADRLVLKYDEVSISISKKSKKIVEVVQQEQINTITCPQPGTLRVDASTKSFDWNGSPLRLEQAVMISKITQPFEQRETLNGVDLRPSFKDYLVSHNLADLVPESLSK